MCKYGKIFKKLLGVSLGAYAALFAVFYFDLDGKALFNIIEPALCKHYDNMPRKDMLTTEYGITKFPDYNK